MKLKAVYLFAILLLFPVFTKANSNLDSLTNLLSKDQPDTVQVLARIQLAHELEKTDKTAAFVNLQESIDLAHNSKAPYFLGISYKELGLYYFRNNEYKLCLENLLISENYFNSGGLLLEQASVVNYIGLVYIETGNLFDALVKFVAVERMLINTENPRRLATVYLNSGAAYQQLEYYDLAERYYQKTFVLANQMQDTLLTGFILNNLGEVALGKKQYLKAKDLFKRSIDIQEGIGDIETLGLEYANLGIAFTYLESFDSAAFFLEKATTIARYHDDIYALINIECNKAAFYNATGKFEKAIEKATYCVEESRRMGVLLPEKQSHNHLSVAYEAVGDFENALSSNLAGQAIRDSIQLGGDKFGLLQVESEFDAQQRIEEMEVEREQAFVQEKSFFETDWFVLVVFFILLTAMIIVLETRRKTNLKMDSENSINVDYLRSTRILLLVAATFYPLLPYVLPKIDPNVIDPPGPRFAISGILLLVYFTSFIFLKVRSRIDQITMGLYILLVAHSFYLIYDNELAIDFFLYLMLILTAVSVIFKKIWSLAIFAVFIVAVAFLIGLTIDEPRFDIKIFIGLVFAEILVAAVVSLSRTDLDKHLQFSNEAVNQADAIVFIVNRKGENIYTNQSIANILGLDPQEFNTHDWIEKLGVSQKEANRIKHNLILIAIGTIEPTFNPYQQFKTKDGEIKWFSIKEKKIDKDRVLVIGLDVTEQKKIQDELASSERNFRQINETLSDVFYLYNIQNQNCEYISPNSEEIMGVPPSFFYEGFSQVDHYVHTEDKTRVEEALVMVRNGIPFDIEYRTLIRGKTRWLREKSYPVRDEKGVVIKHSGLCQDITDRKRAEEEIQRLSLIASNTDNFILIVDEDNRVEWANQSFFNLTGYTEAETVGKLPLELISGRLTSEDLINEISEAVFVEKRQMRCEMINYNKAEEIFYSSLEVTPILDENGNLQKYFVIGSDISRRIADQEQIQKLSLVASNTSNYVIIANSKTGIEWVNQAFTDKFGYELDEVVGKFPSSLLHKKDALPGHVEHINETVFEQGKKFSGEMVHIKKNGQEIYSNVNITPIITEDDGEVEKYFVLGVDISERKKNEEAIERVNQELLIKERALNESEQNFRELIKSIKEVFWLADYESDDMIFVSDSYLQIFGRPHKTLIENPESWRQLIHPADKKRIIAQIEYAGKSGLFNEDFRIVLDSGEEKWINSQIFLISDAEGIPFRMSGFVEDITYKKEQELALSKIADQLDIVHTIEKTILRSESTEEIIYNTLDKTLQKLPVFRASLTLFDQKNKSFYSYARMINDEVSSTDGKEFDLADFSLYDLLNEKRTNHIEDLTTKEVKSKTDEILIAEGAKLALISPLIHGDEMIGSLNVCFSEIFMEESEHYIEITNEVANGLSIAIYQSQLKDKLHASNLSVTSSIDYAKMIQQSYIPTSLSIDSCFTDHLIINRPKDIVSGDFYWVGEYGNVKIVAVGDCTGHGVPGAFMTIIGISELNNIVNHNGIVDPAEILTELDIRIIAALSTTDSSIQLKDGMDIGIFCYNTQTGQAAYAGARRPLYQLSNGELTSVLGTRRSIGDTGDNFGVYYQTTVIEIGNKDDQFYIFSDGCTDQFGGERIRKFSRKRLEEVMQDGAGKSFAAQKKLINSALMNWQGDHFQTDDILLVGFKIGG